MDEARLGEQAPSVELIRDLLAADVETADRLDLVRGWERVKSWIEACQADVLARIDQDIEDSNDRWIGEEVGLALGITGGSARRRLSDARELSENLPQLHSALRDGAVTNHHARLATHGVIGVPVEIARRVEETVLAAGPSDVFGMSDDPRRIRDQWRTPNQLARILEREVIRADPAGALARRRWAVRDRRPGFATSATA